MLVLRNMSRSSAAKLLRRFVNVADEFSLLKSAQKWSSTRASRA
jgi:hypothetical protein